MTNTIIPIMSGPPIRGAGRRFKGGGFHAARDQAGPTGSFATTQPGLIVKTTDSTPVRSGISTPAGIDRPRFQDFTGLSPEIFPSLPFETCTEVQAATLPTILAGDDVLAQAKTGTGKTLAFLVPVVQHLLSAPMPPSALTSILILSPTRELAQQINEVAERMSAALNRKFGTRSIVGGTNMDRDIKNLKSKRADILVATPGRLLDLMENGGIKTRFAQLKMIVLDEADRLLDAGFRRELVKIFDYLPAPHVVPRQTLLFSATLPTEVHSIASIALKKDYKFITTLTEEDVNAHEHVRQEFLVISAEDLIPATMEVMRNEESKNKDFKVIAFLPTARAAALFHGVFSSLPISYPVWEIHSRLSQSKRASTTEAFHQARRGVLFSSDVTARGIDVKGVTAVVQIGLPSSSEQYVHRLGRTARAGAEGHGILMLGDFESHFLRDKTLQTFTLHPYPTITPEVMSRSRDAVNKALESVSPESKAQAYQAWLGYYNSHLKSLRWSQADLVRHAGDYARVSLRNGPEPPGLLAKTVSKMGLRGVPGLNIVKEVQKSAGGQGRPQIGKRGRESVIASENALRGGGKGSERGGRGERGNRGGGGNRRGRWRSA
ncbi:hypothetical protein AYX13_02283 [Cryptococcus neoformans]|nr:hypothetical protein AYX13_02283 [Cryptococcus neoformans var. grubii]